MGGSGGGGTFSGRSPDQMSQLVRKAESSTASAAFETRLSGIFGEQLAAFNSRDNLLVQERLSSLKSHLENELEGTLDHLFGGSVAKRTYVDGLSDVDSLLLINDTRLVGSAPSAVLDVICDELRNRFASSAQVTHGNMAVTVEYPDGMSIQLLPAVRTSTGTLRIPSSRHDDWSHIDPKTFQEALTRRNEECGGKLIPT